MPHLILSDIHANREALDAVLADASGQYDRILCLGDLAGYGAEPNHVVEWVRASGAVMVRGNHDKAWRSAGAFQSRGARVGRMDAVGAGAAEF